MKPLLLLSLLALTGVDNRPAVDFPDLSLAQLGPDTTIETRISSKILGQERDLIVHLPAGHNARERYPVLYVLDGSSQDQPLADKIDSLVRARLLPATIVVGIPNMSGTNRTMQLVPPFMRTDPAKPDSPLGTGDQFLEFLEHELVPYIATTYHASDLRLFAGNSRGGLLVLYSLIQKPDLFAGRICFSTPLWRENHLLTRRLAEVLARTSALPSFLYLSAGAQETDSILAGLDIASSTLKKHAPPQLTWYAERTPGVDHQRNADLSGWSALQKWGTYLGR